MKQKVIIEDNDNEEEKEYDLNNAGDMYDESIPSTPHSVPLEKRATSNSKNIQVIQKLMIEI